jgi:hypothetical protein
MAPPDSHASAIPFALPSASSSSKPSALNPLPASDVRLFITNLALLDLDRRPDWPHITVDTFSAKNADQRQRIAASEWALFRLFELYDPPETALKLQPFFPPLEPLQSLNLRAALFRCLSDLKKDGLLGRESILRKTMLDECKGDRFYDILALFSTLVLKKHLAATRPRNAPAPAAYRLATASTLAPDAQRSMLPIAIAHKASLTALLRRKDEKRRLFTDFNTLLDAKKDEFNRRLRNCNDTSREAQPAVSQRDADAVKRLLTDNWIGNQKWMGVLLQGDQVNAGDAFLTTRFDNVWSMVQTGRKMEDAAPEPSLLENLQSRVQEQQSRLQKWKTFHEELLKEKNTASSSKATRTAAPMKELKFDAHTQYQLPSTVVASQLQQRRTVPSQYHDILADMDAELLRVSMTKPHVSAPLRKRRTSLGDQCSPLHGRKTSQGGMLDGPTSPIRQTQPSFPKKRVGSITSDASATTPPADPDTTLAGRISSMRISASADHHAQSPARAVEAHSEISSSPPPMNSPTPSHRPIPSTTPGPIFAHPIPTLRMPSLDPEEALAEDIIDAIGNATPSPVKKPQPRMSMSLMDRTRMTMSRTTSFDAVTESPSSPHSDSDEDDLPLNPTSPLGSPLPNKQATLLERTLHSVTMAQSARSTSIPSNDPSASTSKPDRTHSRKSRSSLFPVNQFDTPRSRKSFEAIEQAKSVEKTPKEDLFDDEIDYDRVFKSRPRIATSPIFSPEKDRFDFDDDDEVTGIDLGDVDMSDGEDAGGFTQSWADSPSRRTGRVR